MKELDPKKTRYRYTELADEVAADLEEKEPSGPFDRELSGVLDELLKKLPPRFASSYS